MIDFVKKIIYKFFIRKKETDLLTSFNIKTNNKIYSTHVSLSAIKGHDIEIQENTIIDQASIIESYTYVGMNSAITKATVGRYCSIANNVSIGPGEHDLTRISTSSFFYTSPFDKLTEKDCIIGNDVWIGVDCIIKRGIKIADGAVIGANSIVTKDVPPYAIVVGSPAKIIRHRFNDESIEILLKSSWWKYDIEEAKKLQEKLEKVLIGIPPISDNH